jgi:homoserine kinase type II
VSCEPIKAGIENTNYFVTTTQGRYVLTLFERLPAEELPFYLNLMAHLARHGIPVPGADRRSRRPVPARPERQAGGARHAPARALARASRRRPNAPSSARSSDGCISRALLLRVPGESARPAVVALCRRGRCGHSSKRAKFAFWTTSSSSRPRHRFPDLPRGPVHADLFRDNALFEKGRISGVIDFYFAGVDCPPYDVAVCANDWCLVDPQADRRLDEARTKALLEACHSVRPFSAPGTRRVAGDAARRGAALLAVAAVTTSPCRVRACWCTRTIPEHFRDLLELRMQAPPIWVD